MYDAQGKVLYVGKAKNLRNRLKSYFQKNLATKVERLMAQVHEIKVTVTETENEALLLECNLIKDLQPRYNILLRDDKSYPYLYVSNDPFPRIDFYRGNKTLAGRYFGPYPNGTAVREALNLIQKLFLIRQCSDSFYQNRSRPCLQYQIGRCKAPCVNLVSEADYAKDIEHAAMFLQGRENLIMESLQVRMQQAAEAKRYEEAARYRDTIANLRQLQEQQVVSQGSHTADVMALSVSGSAAVISLLRVREGRLIANQTFYPVIPKDVDANEAMQSFMSQFYLVSQFGHDIPSLIVSNKELPDKALIIDVISAKIGRQVEISYARRGERYKWLKLAVLNANNALERLRSNADRVEKDLLDLQEALNLSVTPQRIECFDISHTSGRETYASCVVYDTTGLHKEEYRRFKIAGITPGDDYAAMHQAIKRRYLKLQNEQKALPDILLIDGGQGQVTQAVDVLRELEIQTILIVGIAKGPTRKLGFETLIMNGTSVILEPENGVLRLFQLIRDEAHRFAITGHRKARQKASKHSKLEDIAGVGPVKRRALLNHFGGLQGIGRASMEELCKVKGIDEVLAQNIYDVFHIA